MKSNNINTRWFKNLKGDERENFEKLLRNTKIILSRLKEILEEDEKELISVSPEDYKNPSWAYLQAHKNGELAYNKKLQSLLKFL